MAAVITTAIVGAACASAQATPPDVPSSMPTARAAGGELGVQDHEAGAVSVAAFWLADPTPVARVSLDTHSVDLEGFDLAVRARVRLDGGPWIAAAKWDARRDAHHRSGTLSFTSLDPRAFASARVIELEVREVAVPSHLLRWERAR